MGGDEFIIILAHHHMAMLQQILDEIKALFTKPWMLKGTDYYCTMSMGVVRFPADGDTVEELIKKADIALYSANVQERTVSSFMMTTWSPPLTNGLTLKKHAQCHTKCFQ